MRAVGRSWAGKRFAVSEVGAAAVMAAIGLVGGGGAGACRPPLPGWHQIVTGQQVLLVVLPALAFLVLGYRATGIRSRPLRLIAGVATLALTLLAWTASMALMPACGTWAPD
jgi:hypothetical protein